MSTGQPTTNPPDYQESALPVKTKEDAEQAPEKKLPFPKSVFFIVVNEFCERFCYYGMRTVLVLFLRNILEFSEKDATVLYHAFAMMCYFTPVLGAIIADNYLGKFHTILWLSILYAIGTILLAVGAIPDTPQKELSMTGLFVIALGTGGIKPCVSAFGGDQFVRPQQDKYLEVFFSVFYISINAGSLISTFVTPILREDVHCFGEETCYSLAFGLPAILMLIAVVVFVAGKPLYKIKMPEGNILGDFAMCILRAIWRKITVKGEKHDHWLEFASDKYDKQLIEDTKRVCAVGFIFLPLPIFWTLYDQQGSRWTFQATRMNGDLGGWVLKPDQVQIINPLLILILVPVFESLIYPAFKKCNLLTPLQRICCGLIFCGLSFVVSGFVEISLEPTYAKIPGEAVTQMNFISTVPCQVNFAYLERNASLSPKEPTYFDRDIEACKPINASAYIVNPSECGVPVSDPTWSGDLGSGNGTEGYSVLFTLRNEKLEVFRLNEPDHLEKSESGNPLLAFIIDFNNRTISNGSITITNGNYEKTFEFSPALNVTETTPDIGDIVLLKPYEKGVEIGTYDVKLYLADNNETITIGQVKNLIQGGVYTAVIQRPPDGSNGNDTLLQIEVTSGNTVSILWLIPQYFVVTVGEVMFSVTGLSFSYSQAPPSMKSVMQAMWLMIVAFGNLIVIIVEEVNGLKSRAAELFLFAGIMGVASIIFTLLSLTYTYVETDEEKRDREAKEKKEKELSDAPTTTTTPVDDSSSSSSSSSDEDEPEGKDNRAMTTNEQ